MTAYAKKRLNDIQVLISSKVVVNPETKAETYIIVAVDKNSESYKVEAETQEMGEKLLYDRIISREQPYHLKNKIAGAKKEIKIVENAKNNYHKMAEKLMKKKDLEFDKLEKHIQKAISLFENLQERSKKLK